MKAALKFTIASNDDSRERISVRLYREGCDYVWRITGNFGDECETLPRPKSIKQARQDARAVFGRDKIWDMRANWWAQPSPFRPGARRRPAL